MVSTAAQIWRNWNVDGVPSSGVSEPDKIEIRAWGAWLEGLIAAFTANGGLIYASKALLDADLAHAANSMAWVIGDPVAANNGVYGKVGASGTGSWTRRSDLPFSFIIATDAGAGTPNAIQATTSIPVSGSALVWMNIFEANTGTPVTVSFNGGAVLTIKTNSGNNPTVGGLVSGMIVLGVVSGSTFRLVSDQASAAIVAAAEAAQAAAEAARDEAVTLVGAAASAVQPPQIDLPTAMTSASVQAVADVAGPNGRHVHIPKGDVIMSAPLVTGAQAISIEGVGPRSSRLLVAAAISALEHGLAAQNYFSTLDIKNLGFTTANAGSLYGIDAKFDRNSGGFTMSDIRFDAFGAGLEFDTYVRAVGATNTHWQRVKAVCAIGDTAKNRAATTQLGALFQSFNNADKSYVYTFDDVSLDANNIGFQFDILGFPGDSGSLEGVIFRNGLGRTNIGAWVKVYVPNSASLWHPPYWIFDSCNWQGTGAWVHMDSAAEVHIDKGLIYTDTALPIEWNPDGTDDLTGDYTPALNTMQFVQTKKLTIHDTSVVALPGSKVATMIYIGPGCDDVSLENITLEYQAGATVAAGIYIDTTATNVRWHNITWKNWPVGVPKIWDGTNPLPATIRGGPATTRILSASGNNQLIITGSETAVNTLQIEVADTTFGPLLRPGGPDTNIDFHFRTKGTGTGYLRDGISNVRFSWNQTGIGYFGIGPVAKQTVSGSKGGNAALTSLIAAFAAYGLITDSTT